MEKTIIGYNLKFAEYRKATLAICGPGYIHLGRENGKDADINLPTCRDKLRDAGVLDLWFEPVYAEEELRILKGNYYYCIKDIIMDSDKDDIAYTKGRIYLSDKNDNLPDNDTSEHSWGRLCKEGEVSNNEHFRLATPEEIEVYNAPKPGDWYICLPGFSMYRENYGGSGYVEGKVFQVYTVDSINQFDSKYVLFPKTGSGIFSKAVRRATPEEISRVSSKTITLGDKDIQVIVKKDSVEADGKKVSIDQIQKLFNLTQNEDISGILGVSSPWKLRIPSIKVGCTTFSEDDLAQIIKVHKSLN